MAGPFLPRTFAYSPDKPGRLTGSFADCPEVLMDLNGTFRPVAAPHSFARGWYGTTILRYGMRIWNEDSHQCFKYLPGIEYRPAIHEPRIGNPHLVYQRRTSRPANTSERTDAQFTDSRQSAHEGGTHRSKFRVHEMLKSPRFRPATSLVHLPIAHLPGIRILVTSRDTL